MTLIEVKPTRHPTPEIVAERVEAYILHARAQGAMCSKSQIALYRSYPDAMRRGEPHPWYGPCDGMGTNGECSECERFL